LKKRKRKGRKRKGRKRWKVNPFRSERALNMVFLKGVQIVNKAISAFESGAF